MAHNLDLLERLFKELEAARGEFERAPRERKDGRANNPRRLGAEKALGAISNWLNHSGKVELAEPFQALLFALIDADGGRSNTLIKPAEYAGGPKILLQDQIEMSSAAAEVTRLMGGGVSLENASSREARRIGKDPQKLKEFRDNILRGRAPRLCIARYEDWLRTRP